MAWNKLKESSPEEIVKGVAEKDEKPKEDKGSSAKCPACGASLHIDAVKDDKE